MSRTHLLGLALVLAVVVPHPAVAGKRLLWSKRLGDCEPPADFYSSRHRSGMRPCCPLAEAACPGGQACPPSGTCANSNTACSPGPRTSRPNVILFISDDQNECAYGSAGECRSAQTGTPIPAPITPNLDLLAGYGTVFPIAHNTAQWCFPSLNAILTGRYQRSFEGQQRIADHFPTIAKALRGLLTSSAPADPFDSGNRIGGYCTFVGGKFTSSIGDHGFDAVDKGRSLGRIDCSASSGNGAPRCGTDASSTYDPTTLFTMSAVFQFLDSMTYARPGGPSGAFDVQPFFLWYAPRIPHLPFRAPEPVATYLYGPNALGPQGSILGGAFNLGQYCAGGNCAPVVAAMQEKGGGLEDEYYENVYWADANVRELRKWLARASAPHCIGGDGRARFNATQASCPGTWATDIAPDLERNTVLIYLSDNGFALPNSKHNFTENAYRTRLIVFDPRNLPTVPSWDSTQVTAPPPAESPAVAHGIDALPTALGFALGTPGSQACPVGDDGKPCDGRDLRPVLATAPGGPASPESLRHALCGHETNRPTAPTNRRFIDTRPGSVGRCTDLATPTCLSSADCGSGQYCLGGHCLAVGGGACSSSANCPVGSVCLGGSCRSGPPCTDVSDCAALMPGRTVACTQKQTKWCRNDPTAPCTTRDDCPACPLVGGNRPPCGRVCEPRVLKLYVSPSPGASNIPRLQLTDLFLDPDEVGLDKGPPGTLTSDMSQAGGPYSGAMQRLNCCVDQWWPDIAASTGTQCHGTCPADFSCTN